MATIQHEIEINQFEMLNPKNSLAHFLTICEIWASHCDGNFDVEFWNSSMMIDLFITYMRM